jgi:DNA-binding PucR family transcriptional regulator
VSPSGVGQFPEGDLFSLANVLAERIGGPVILEDANFEVLAYSSFTGTVDPGRDRTILGRRMLPEWIEHLERTGALGRLRTSTDVIDISSGPWQARRRLITAVRWENRLIGVLWAAEDGSLPADAPERLRESADLAAPHLLRHHDSHRAERLWRGRLVRSLLDGRDDFRRHADELGLPRNATYAVLGFTPDEAATLTDDEWDRLTDHVALSCGVFRWQSAVSRSGATVFALVVVPADSADDAVLRLGREIAGRVIPVLGRRLRGAVSTAGPGLSEIRARRWETENALEVLRNEPSADNARFVRYDDVRPLALLHEFGLLLADRPDLRLPALWRLEEEDARKHSALLPTLRTYLQSNMNASEAARRLNLHVTTLRYRLGRIREVSGLDLDDPRIALVCNLLLVTGAIRSQDGNGLSAAFSFTGGSPLIDAASARMRKQPRRSPQV